MHMIQYWNRMWIRTHEKIQYVCCHIYQVAPRLGEEGAGAWEGVPVTVFSSGLLALWQMVSQAHLPLGIQFSALCAIESPGQL